MTSQFDQQIAYRRIPNANRWFNAMSGQSGSIRRKTQAEYRTLPAGPAQQLLTGFRIPYTGGGVERSGGNSFSIRRYIDTDHAQFMASQAEQAPAIGEIPDANRAVTRS